MSALEFTIMTVEIACLLIAMLSALGNLCAMPMPPI